MPGNLNTITPKDNIKNFMLPDCLSDWRIASCLQDCPKKKAFLLEHKEKHIILKYAREEYSSMLHNEEKIAAGKKSFPFFPYIISCFDTDMGTYLIREYIEGETLQELVERKGILSLNEALLLMLKLSDCLISLHSARPFFIYRDLKAANVLFTSSGDCYLLDMGTVRLFHESAPMDTSLIGTPAVAAPEQYGFMQTDKRTDVYGFGMLFYYLLTGKILSTVKNEKPLEAFDLIKNRRARSIIRKCTAFDPENRYIDMEAVKKDMKKLLKAINNKNKWTAAGKITSASLWLLSVMLTARLLKYKACGNLHKTDTGNTPPE